MPPADLPVASAVRAVPVGFRPGSAEGPREETSLLGFLSILLFHRRLIGIAALAGMAAFGLIAASHANLYLSRASFVVKGSRAPAMIPGGAAALGISLSAAAEFSQSIVFYSELVKAKAILLPVARKSYATSTGKRGERRTLASIYGIEETNPDVAAVRATNRLLLDVASNIYSRSGVVGIAVQSTDPLVAQQIATNILAELNAYARTRRHAQAVEERRFIEGLVAEARQRLAQAEEEASDFSRLNRQYQESPDLRLENDRLARAVAMRQQIYTALAQSYEQAKIEEVRDQTVLNVVEPPDLPPEPERREALRITFLGLAVGLLAGVVLAFLRQRALESRAASTAGFMEFSAAMGDGYPPIRNPQ